ncbi:MAG: hypothetical protein AAGE05_04300 [Pseudomonadota bacterium]
MTEDMAIKRLRKLAKDWPSDLWLFAEGGSLHVMRLGPDGARAMNKFGGVDHAYIQASIAIPSDGGAW